MNKLFICPLGLEVYASKPCIAAPIAAALVAGGAGLVSSLIGSSSQSSTNESSLKGVRETNKANIKLYRESVDNNRLDTAMQRGYETPVRQVARLRQAGINPSGDVSSQLSASVSPAQAPQLQSPSNVPAPFGNMNLGGIARDAISAYQSGQQITDTQMQLYQHGIESATFYQQKMNQLRSQELDIISKGIQTTQDYELLKKLQIDIKYYENQWKSHMREMDDIHDESMKKQTLYDRQANDILNRFDLDVSRVKGELMHMSNEDAVSRILAAKEVRVAGAEIKRIDYEVRDFIASTKLKIKQGKTEDVKRIWTDQLSRLDAHQKEAFLASLAIQVEHEKQKDKSQLAHMLRIVTGVDVSNLLQTFSASLLLK